MKLSRILLTALAIGAVTLTSLNAEDAKGRGKGRGPSPQEMVATIDKDVGGLTADQKAKIEEIMTKAQEQRQALSQEERKEKGREIQNGVNEKVRAVLTAEQKTKYDEAMGQRRQKGGQGGKKKKAE